MTQYNFQYCWESLHCDMHTQQITQALTKYDATNAVTAIIAQG